MSDLILQLFGAPRITLDGVPVHVRRRKAVALLAYLAVTQQPHSREFLAVLLWPESNQTSSRDNLRRVLSSLRRTLGSSWFQSDRASITLIPSDGLQVDVLEARALVTGHDNHRHEADSLCPDCIRALERVVSLQSADFLSGFTLADSPLFDDWQRRETERLRADLAMSLEKLGRTYARLGEVQPAIEHTRNWVSLDALHGPAQYLLIQLLANAGQTSAALRQYESYVQRLQDELGVQVEQEFAELHRQIGAIQTPSSLDIHQALVQIDGISPPSSVSRLPDFLDNAVEPEVSEQHVFVAREHRMAQLGQYLDTALAGHGQVIFVIGEAGSGKTTLIHEFARRAQDDHADLIVASGICDVYTGVGDPYLPFRDVFNMLAGDVEAPWSMGAITRDHARRIWRLVPEFADILFEYGSDLLDTFVSPRLLSDRLAFQQKPDSPMNSGLQAKLQHSPGQNPNQGRLFEEYTDVVRMLSLKRPLILLLDDLHWADLSSLSLLLHLGRRISNHRVLIIGTYRPEEIGLDGQSHPLEQVAGELKGRSGEIEIFLDQSLLTEGRYFVDALLDSFPNRLEERFRQALFRHSRGHALFTVELLKDLQDRAGLILDDQGRWVENEQLSWATLPAKVEGVIEKRFSRLDAELREAMIVASVEGERFTAEIVARVQDMDERGLIRRLSNELEKRHRLVRAQGVRRLGGQRLSRYRFRHNLFQQYLYHSLDDVERSMLHEEVGRALEALYQDQPAEKAVIAAQLAWHFQEAGVTEKAIEYRYQAGQWALQLSANDEAIEHFNQGLSLLDQLSDRRERLQRELALQVALGVPMTAVYGYTSLEAEQVYTRAWELCSTVGATSQTFTALYGLWRTYTLRAELTRSWSLAEQLMALADDNDDPALRVEAKRAVGVNLFHTGDLVAARSHLEQGLTLYDIEAHQEHALVYGHDPAVSCLGYLSHTLWLLGYPQRALERIEELLVFSEELSHPFSRGHALVWGAAQTYQFRHEIRRTIAQAEEGLALATERRFPLWIAGAQIMFGWGLGASSQADGQEQGLVHLQKGYATWQALGTVAGTPYFLGLMADIYLRIGRIKTGSETVDAAFLLMEETNECWWEAELWRLRGELRRVQGASSIDVESAYQKALAVARRQQAKSLELRAAVSLGRLWLQQGRREDAYQLVFDIHAWFSEGFDTQDLIEARSLLDASTDA